MFKRPLHKKKIGSNKFGKITKLNYCPKPTKIETPIFDYSPIVGLIYYTKIYYL